MDATLRDGTTLRIDDLGGDGLPVVVLHGGPGLDHTYLRPWLDPLAPEFRLIYVDQRGQGRSARVDPELLSIARFAYDIDLLVDRDGVLGLDRYAILGHSFGAIVATEHAIAVGTAAGYVIAGGADSSAGLEADVAASLAAYGDGGDRIAASWEAEKTVATDDEFRALLRDQLPFHFHGPPPPGFGEETRTAPEVLRHFANVGYGDFDFAPGLARVTKPVLLVVGENDRTTTRRASEALHAGIAGSRLAVLANAGHMSFVEAQTPFLEAVRGFLRELSG